MLKFPKLVVTELGIVKDNIDKDFLKEDLSHIFNGKHSVEDIYADFLSKDYTFEKVNRLFNVLIEHKILEDRLNLESTILSDDEIDSYSTQSATFSYFSQKIEESKYDNLLSGLHCQEKINQSSLILLGDSILIGDIFNKGKNTGLKTIHIYDNLDAINYNADLLIFAPKNYDENEMLDALKYCKKNLLSFLPIINTSYGVEIGPFYVPNDASCYLCLINRKKSVLGENYDSHISNTLNFNFSVGSDVVLIELIKYFTGIAPLTLRNKVLQYNFMSGIFVYHPVLKMPNCEICSSKHVKPLRKLWEGIV